MIDQIACLNYVPSDPQIFDWTDALVHPGTSVEELWEIAWRMAFQSPLKIFVPPREQIPRAWVILRSLWENEWSGSGVNHYRMYADQRRVMTRGRRWEQVRRAGTAEVFRPVLGVPSGIRKGIYPI